MELTMKYLVVLTVLAAVIVGCDRGGSAAPAAPSSEALPRNLFVAAAPANAQDVAAAKSSAKSGDSITVRGRVGGSPAPLAANRAMLTLTDLSLPTCDKTPMDQCKTPWDSCCEPKDEITARSLTVQVIDAAGKPLKQPLNGAGGLAPGK
jgi:hypothetical protein